jgi:hypothetical protein
MRLFTYVSGTAYQGTIAERIVTIEAAIVPFSSTKIWEIRDPESKAIIGRVARGKEKAPDGHEFVITELVCAFNLGQVIATTRLQKGIKDLLGIGD